MEKQITDALTSNIDFIALALVILGGLFTKNYLSAAPMPPLWLRLPTALKTLIVGSLFMSIWVTLQLITGTLHKADLSRLFFTYCVATSLYELILKYIFAWLAKRGITT